MVRGLSVFVAMLAACMVCACGGGASSTAPDSGSTNAQFIRFVARYETSGTLTISPLAGATNIGTAPIAKVVVNTDSGRVVQELSTPNSTNASGQAVFSFPVSPAAPTASNQQFHCGVPFDLHITVIDVNGMQLATDARLCPSYTTEWGVFSDAGTRTASMGAGIRTPPGA